MFAVIHRSATPRGAGVFPLAGPALVLRQLQWLRGAGFERVVLDLGTDAASEALRRVVTEQHALAKNVVLVPSPGLPKPTAVAQAAGLPPGTPLLAIPETVIGNADLGAFYREAPKRGIRVGRMAPPPSGGPFEAAEVHLITAITGPVETQELPGWGATVDTPGAALKLACEALLGRLPLLEGGVPLLLHAAEHSPGVWVARGGRIQRGAEVHAPALVGPHALVCSGALIGPGAIIGDHAIIEKGTTIRNAVVAPETVVGEGLDVRDAIASPEGLASLEGDGIPLPLGDPLLLTRRRSLSKAALRLLGLKR